MTRTTTMTKKRSKTPSVEVLTSRISRALRQARESIGWTQDEAAEQVRAERKTIWYWESGNALKPLVYVHRIVNEGNSEAASILMAEVFGLDSGFQALADDLALKAALKGASNRPAWPRIREAILAMLRAQEP